MNIAVSGKNPAWYNLTNLLNETTVLFQYDNHIITILSIVSRTVVIHQDRPSSPFGCCLFRVYQYVAPRGCNKIEQRATRLNWRRTLAVRARFVRVVIMSDFFFFTSWFVATHMVLCRRLSRFLVRCPSPSRVPSGKRGGGGVGPEGV